MIERTVAVVGRTGFGKSTIVRQLVQSHDRVVILEQKAEKIRDWDGLDVEWFSSWRELYGTMKEIRPRRFRVGFIPGRAFFVDALRLAWALGDVLLVIEEAGKYFPYNKKARPHHKEIEYGGNMNVPGEFLEICERGRHAGPRGDGTQPVRLVVVSQRPKRLPLCFQAELDRTYAFKLQLPHDRSWLAECPGADEQLAAQARDLPKYHFFNICAEGGVTRETTRP